MKPKKMKIASFELSLEHYQKLQQVAADQGRSFSSLIRMAIKKHL